MLLSGTSLLSWKAGNTKLDHFHRLSTPQEAGVQLETLSPCFSTAGHHQQYCKTTSTTSPAQAKLQAQPTHCITLPRPSHSPGGLQLAWLLRGHLAFGLLAAF